MRPNTVLLAQLALLTSSAHAFFPYTPTWLKEIEDLNTANEAKRSVGVGNGVTFELKQRARNTGPESQAQKAAWQASLISHKYDHRRITRFSSDRALAKRSNQYSIMQAVDPKQPRTAGVNQDGADYSYFIQAQLGSKGKEMYMLIDTGAGSSWVMGTGCKSDACSKHNTFGPGDSDTLELSSKDFTISYGSGDLKGMLANDTIKVADMSLRYQFGLASTTSTDFVHFAFDGILGLSMNSGANENFLQALASADLLDKNIFCVALNRASDGTNHGEIKFGSTNPDRFTGDIGYTSTAGTGNDWAITLGDIGFDGKKADVGNILAYIDTGTSYIFGPPKPVQALHALIPGAESSDNVTFTVPCDSSKTISVNFSGVDYEISPKDWISPKDSSGKCTSNIYGFEAVTGSWLMGDTFLKNVYAVFDKDEKRIGFAKRADTPSTATTAGVPSATTTSNGKPSSTNHGPGLSGHETSGVTGDAAKATQTPKNSSAASYGQGTMFGVAACILSSFILLV
ncbi:Aspartic-type endopeptidase ctsD [Cladobotryum mycophilum]|uniref:Aspartic-type endopeptidase ctsD n=1 Tax=Cladobotryum mycophilum TaxID=491253 RepID=A0ABR0SBI6_9HYPO